jgi:hypothetical protein
LDVVERELVLRKLLPTVDASVAVALEDPVSLHMDDLPNSRRLMMNKARQYLLQQIGGDPLRPSADDDPPRLTLKAIEKISMSRSRERILANLDEMYREAFERAKETGDASQMAALDFAYRREQLYFEILLDVRDGMERKG